MPDKNNDQEQPQPTAPAIPSTAPLSPEIPPPVDPVDAMHDAAFTDALRDGQARFGLTDPELLAEERRRQQAAKDLARANSAAARAAGKLFGTPGTIATTPKAQERLIVSALGEGDVIQVLMRNEKGALSLVNTYQISDITSTANGHGDLDSFVDEVLRPLFGDQEFIVNILNGQNREPKFFRNIQRLAQPANGTPAAGGDSTVALVKLLLDRSNPGLASLIGAQQPQGGFMGAKDMVETVKELKAMADSATGGKGGGDLMQTLLMLKMFEKPDPPPPQPAIAPEVAEVLSRVAQRLDQPPTPVQPQGPSPVETLAAIMQAQAAQSQTQMQFMMAALQPKKEESTFDKLLPLLVPMLPTLMQKIGGANEESKQALAALQRQLEEMRAAAVQSQTEALKQQIAELRAEMKRPEKGVKEMAQELAALREVATQFGGHDENGPNINSPPSFLENLPDILGAASSLIGQMRAPEPTTPGRVPPLPDQHQPQLMPRRRPQAPAAPPPQQGPRLGNYLDALEGSETDNEILFNAFHLLRLLEREPAAEQAIEALRDAAQKGDATNTMMVIRMISARLARDKALSGAALSRVQSCFSRNIDAVMQGLTQGRIPRIQAQPVVPSPPPVPSFMPPPVDLTPPPVPPVVPVPDMVQPSATTVHGPGFEATAGPIFPEKGAQEKEFKPEQASPPTVIEGIVEPAPPTPPSADVPPPELPPPV